MTTNDHEYKIVRTSVTYDDVAAAQGGYYPAGHPSLVWVRCPARYVAEEITADDIMHDCDVTAVEEPTETPEAFAHFATLRTALGDACQFVMMHTGNGCDGLFSQGALDSQGEPDPLFIVAELRAAADSLERIANARLIAAAPELLEALEDAADLMERRGEHETSACYARMRAAIAKAKGEA